MRGAGIRSAPTSSDGVVIPLPAITPWRAYGLRLKRRRLLWRSFRSRHALRPVANRTASIAAGDILVLLVQRNEMIRLPHFFAHYRDLGAAHFLVVDNDSDDGSREWLAEQHDVSLWHTVSSYRQARFGLDWVSWLLMRYGHGHWCLTVDADELLVYDGMDSRDLPALASELSRRDQPAFGALMLDMFARGPIGTQTYEPGENPVSVLNWFDTGPYRARRQSPMGNLWVQGGARDRVFFSDRSHRAPTLNKLPFLRWNRRFAYVNSTHTLLPRRLNAAYDGPGDPRPCGVLLHTKFLPGIIARSKEERRRRQHFTDPSAFVGYYDHIETAPDLWHADAQRYHGPEQLVALGLMSAIRTSG